jgi:hypothetical protein
MTRPRPDWPGGGSVARSKGHRLALELHEVRVQATDGASTERPEVPAQDPSTLADVILVFAGLGAHRLR